MDRAYAGAGTIWLHFMSMTSNDAVVRSTSMQMLANSGSPFTYVYRNAFRKLSTVILLGDRHEKTHHYDFKV